MSKILEEENIDKYPTRVEDQGFVIRRQEPEIYTTKLDNNNSFLTIKQLNNYARNGFLTISNLFSKEEIDILKKHANSLKFDDKYKDKEEAIIEPESKEVRSIFAIDKNDKIFKALASDERLINIAKTLLGSDVYIHQSRINYKPGFKGKEFYWHSDFETWHAEDGMPKMRTVSCSISLTDNHDFNGPLMVIPSSHKQFIACKGKTPKEHYKESLKKQEYGVPDNKIIENMVNDNGVVVNKGKAGSVIFFECNLIHGSNSNITPYPRTNIFFVYNSVENTLVEPYSAKEPRPEYIANRSNFQALEALKVNYHKLFDE